MGRSKSPHTLQTLASIRELDLAATFMRETGEFVVDYRHGDPRRHGAGPSGRGNTAYRTAYPSHAVAAAKRMCAVPEVIEYPRPMNGLGGYAD